MTIEAKVIADSINELSGDRITTMLCTYNRWIHCELLTHRNFSRNSASSRAIPIEKMIKAILDNPALPVSWGKNQRGMQANEDLSPEQSEAAERIWIEASEDAIKHVQRLTELGVHKQIANRLLEPWAHISTLITSTEWGNFFNLRAHPDAQPEFQELAYAILAAYTDSTPVVKQLDEWHLPFADRYINEGLELHRLLQITTARAARLSYLNFDGDISHEKDYVLHDNLCNNGHWSPFEHAAAAVDNSKCQYDCGNFKGWMPYRKTFPTENQKYFNAEQLTKRRKLCRRNK